MSMSNPRNKITVTAANQRKLNQLEASMQAILTTEVLRRGFFGTVKIELSIQDGTIQHVRSTLERIEQ